ncbi:CapA family protein [Mesosutterella sp. AGMB02718]|uniref:CapA family protein n=1 Tax=Mesosutterella faecium TaxID=2925194 RepID=A0ABT7IQY6_9BURK|nr:CapA family protein [Mesosutterella sp. AGMB02718]MDL2060318.1 CapA family protein [Mesosutterella sp. AGMB02718]
MISRRKLLQIALASPLAAGGAPALAQQRAFTLAFCGDIMMGSTFPGEALPEHDGQKLFADAAPVLRSADLAFGNLEGTLLEGGETQKVPSPTTYAFRTPVRYARYLKEAGFDFLSLANNHAGDFGEEGMDSTQRCLREQGIAFAGIRGRCEYALIERGGVRFGVAAFGHNSYTLRHGDEAEVRRILAALRRRADLIVVSFHGGAEGRDRARLPYGEEIFLNEKRGSLRQFAHLCVDLGADAVFGHGPHVPRAVEVYKGRFIAYSLGNFCTPYMVSLKGISGLAPVIEIRMSASGRFLSGQIYSFRQIRGVGPRLDPGLGAAKLIKTLSEEDISPRFFTIDDSGRILPAAAAAPAPAPVQAPAAEPAGGPSGESAEPEDPRIGEDILIEEPAPEAAP